MSLASAQADRRARSDALISRSVSEVVDLLADEVNLSNADRVGPATREKLKGPLLKYAKSAHPWQDCVNDITPKKGSVAAVGICSVLKDIIRGTTYWRGKNNPRDTGTPGVVGLSDPCVAVSMMLDDEAINALAYFSEVDVDDLVEDNFALTAAQRKALPASDFALPKTRQYPMPDRLHAGLALGRAKGKPEFAAVKAAVCKRYSTMPSCSDGGGGS